MIECERTPQSNQTAAAAPTSAKGEDAIARGLADFVRDSAAWAELAQRAHDDPARLRYLVAVDAFYSSKAAESAGSAPPFAGEDAQKVWRRVSRSVRADPALRDYLVRCFAFWTDEMHGTPGGEPS